MSGLIFLSILLLPLCYGRIISDSECTDPTRIYYLPNPTNCSEYFECVRGNKFVLVCPAGLVWDQINKVCDSNDYVGCISSTTTATIPTNDPICPSSGITNAFYPYDCTKYYKCVNGQKNVKTCPENLYFDPISLICTYMDLVDCTVTTTIGPTTTSVSTTTSAPTTTTSNPVTDDPLCPSDKIINVVYPYDCSKYYYCVYGKKTLRTCPENLLFDPITLKCGYMDEVECTVTPTPAPDTTSTVTPSTITTTTRTTTTDNPVTNDPLCPSSETMNVVYPYDCRKYYHCVNGKKTLKTCPENLYFNPLTAGCDYMDNVDCTVTTSTSTTITTTTESTTTENTTTESTTTERTTTESTTTKSPTTESTTTEGTTTEGTTTESPTTKSTTTESTTTESTTTESPEVEMCKGKPDGTYLPDPKSCRNFYECAHEIATLLPCPKGTIWDESVLSCVNSSSDCI